MIADIETRTDIGLRRETNEDYVQTLTDEGLIVLCDGMGGHEKGEVASRLAAETITDAFQKMNAREVQEICANVSEDLPWLARRLVAAIRLANAKVYERSKSDPETSRMGTTVVTFCLEKDAFVAAHVGDSRAYRFSKGRLSQITEDHTFSYGMTSSHSFKNSRVSHYITRAIGFARSEKIDVAVGTARPRDRFLLCSDGLSGYVSDEEICSVLKKYASNNKAVEALVAKANEKGGPDNITAALATVRNIAGNHTETMLDVSIVNEENTQTIEFEKALLLNIGEKAVTFTAARADAASKKTSRLTASVVIVLFLLLSLLSFLLIQAGNI